ncbi:MAG: hypothetical protein ACI9W4_000883 [Rhodothermales bacterium]|jgi:hypothetical protein
MKNPIPALLVISLIAGFSCGVPEGGDSAHDESLEFISLFDGETLAGWRVNEGTAFVDYADRWTVEGGVIRGRFLNHFDADSTFEYRPVNTWLVSEKTYSDFILRFSFRIDVGNSGFTYRSIIGSEALDSPEVDLDPGETTGQIYDTRTINGDYVNKDYLTTIDPELLAGAYLVDAYNQMEVWLRGPNVKAYLNGVLVTDYNHDTTTPAGRAEGYIAMELHGSTIASFKDISIRELD